MLGSHLLSPLAYPFLILGEREREGLCLLSVVGLRCAKPYGCTSDWVHHPQRVMW